MSLEELLEYVLGRDNSTELEVELAQRLELFVLGAEIDTEWQHPKARLKNKFAGS